MNVELLGRLVLFSKVKIHYPSTSPKVQVQYLCSRIWISIEETDVWTFFLTTIMSGYSELTKAFSLITSNTSSAISRTYSDLLNSSSQIFFPKKPRILKNAQNFFATDKQLKAVILFYLLKNVEMAKHLLKSYGYLPVVGYFVDDEL